jgi:cobaltochelatase CobT
LLAESRCRQKHTMAGRKIDAKQLAGMSSGDFRVFKKRIEGIKTETAVQIVVDRSGSMSGAPIVVAREACFATALAMQSVPGVSVAVSAFPGCGGTSVIRLSDFGQRVERQIAGFESLNASGGTPLVEALLWSLCHSIGSRTCPTSRISMPQCWPVIRDPWERSWFRKTTSILGGELIVVTRAQYLGWGS